MEELKDNGRLRDSTEGRAVAWSFELEREDDCMGDTSSDKELDHVRLPLLPLDRQKPSNLLPQVGTGGLQDFSPEAGSLSPQFENAESATSQMFIVLRKFVLAAVRLDAEGGLR